MAIFTKNGKILFVDNKVAIDEACCCDGDSLFHLSPDSLVPVTASTDFNDAENIWDRNKVYITDDDGTITKNTGYVYTMHDGPSSNDACGIAPIIENQNTYAFSGTDDFYVRMDYSNLVMPVIAGRSIIPVRRFGIHFTSNLPSSSMRTAYFVGRGQFTNEQREIWRNYGGGVYGSSNIDNSTSGYFEWARSSGVMTLSHNGNTLSSVTNSNSFSGPWFGWKNFFNAGSTAGEARITNIVVQKNDEDVYVLQKKWIDLINPPANDAITPYLTDTSNVWHRPLYIENMKNGLDGLEMGSRVPGYSRRRLDTDVSFPQNICIHAVFNNPNTFDRHIISNWPIGASSAYPSFETDGGKIRLTLGQNSYLSTDANYASGWYVVTGVFNGASSTIYVNGTEVATTRPGSNFEAWDDRILVGHSPYSVDICKVRVTELMRSAEIVSLHSELMTKYDITA